MSRVVSITSVPSTRKIMSPICTPAASAGTRPAQQQQHADRRPGQNTRGEDRSPRARASRARGAPPITANASAESSCVLLPYAALSAALGRRRQRKAKQTGQAGGGGQGLPGPPGSITVMMGTGGNPATPRCTARTQLSSVAAPDCARASAHAARAGGRLSASTHSPRNSNPMPRDIPHPRPPPR